MKKTFKLMGLLLLSLTMTLTSCGDKGPAPANEDNSIVLGDDLYKITSARCVADISDYEAELIFYCNELILTIELEGQTDAAVGAYELLHEGRYTAEIDMVGSDKDYDVTGTLAISREETDNVYSITISGEAYKDRAPRYFSMVYQGELK